MIKKIYIILLLLSFWGCKNPIEPTLDPKPEQPKPEQPKPVEPKPVEVIIHYDANGGSGHMADQLSTLHTPTKLSSNIFTKEGYSFLGWSRTSGDDRDFDFFKNGSFTPRSEYITLYAKWTDEYNSDSYSFFKEEGLIYTYHSGIVSVGLNDEDLAGDIVIPSHIKGYPVTYIEDRAFKDGKNLTKVTIPNSVTSIGKEAFARCTSLEEISLPNNLKTLKAGTFENCTSLKGINIPPSVTSLGGNLFMGCTNLTTATIPEGITELPSYLFFDCSNLTTVTIPSTVRVIGAAFRYCSSLDNVKLPEGLVKLEKFAFNGCESLRSINIPSSVKSISSHTFTNCRSLLSIDFPEGVNVVGNSTFSGCTSLETVTLRSVTSIGASVFSGCSSLKMLNLHQDTPPNTNSSFPWDVSDCEVHVNSTATGFNTGGWIDTTIFTRIVKNL
ncbi:leucine-rich repeat protein [Spirochaeta cellobiosiphila]|uniref:leucine-rich repeat protein n=1 Tax=Spirochaeta cellobiosiphila TaxID=504483 RepID=UPI000403E8DF|nr:leucine-rich repeat protein [Spirochaeta cellobiosiphila]